MAPAWGKEENWIPAKNMRGPERAEGEGGSKNILAFCKQFHKHQTITFSQTDVMPSILQCFCGCWRIGPRSSFPVCFFSNPPISSPVHFSTQHRVFGLNSSTQQRSHYVSELDGPHGLSPVNVHRVPSPAGALGTSLWTLPSPLVTFHSLPGFSGCQCYLWLQR